MTKKSKCKLCQQQLSYHTTRAGENYLLCQYTVVMLNWMVLHLFYMHQNMYSTIVISPTLLHSLHRWGSVSNKPLFDFVDVLHKLRYILLAYIRYILLIVVHLFCQIECRCWHEWTCTLPSYCEKLINWGVRDRVI